jgi:beta-lactamase regulating signal transducer with metallopeptidase domain
MLLSFFDKNYLLVALAWGIICSICQTAFLWLLYRLTLRLVPKSTALFRYNFSLLLFAGSFAGFIITFINSFVQLQRGGFNAAIQIQASLLSQQFIGVFQLIAVVYLVVLAILTSRFLQKFYLVKQLNKTPLVKAPLLTRLFVNQTAMHLGIRKNVQVWLNSRVNTACVSGFLKPVIYLPITIFNQLNTQQAEAVLLHELAHIKRNDYLVNILQTIIELLMFFNPFTLLLSKYIRAERENCCDDWVLSYQFKQHDYATALLLMEQNRYNGSKLLLAVSGGEKGQLLARIKRLFSATPQIQLAINQKLKLAFCTMCMSLLLLFLIPGLQTPTPVVKFANALPARILPGNAKNVFYYTEKLGLNNITNDMALATKQNNPLLTKLPGNTITNQPIAKKRAIANNQLEKASAQAYSLTYINEALLKGQETLANLPVPIVEKEQEIPEQYLVKIEEEVAGSDEKTAYLLEYKLQDGKQQITPLLITNQKQQPLDLLKKQGLPDSLKTPKAARKKFTL